MKEEEKEEVSERIEDSDQLQQSPDLHSSQSSTAQLKEASSMVVVRDSLSLESTIFPPINHEGLFLYPSPPPSPPRLVSLTPADAKEIDPPYDSRVYLARDVSGWLSCGLELFRSKVVRVTYAIRHYAVSKRAVWSFSSATAGIVTAVFVWFLYARARRRRKSIDYLITLIKERDENILQLLHQISHMNEVLLACHRCKCGGLSRDGGLTS